MAELQDVTGYINAGGRGTRLHAVITPHPTLGVSKALLKVGQPPITMVEHHINALAGIGVGRVIAAVGNHAHVAQYVGDRYDGVGNVQAMSVPFELETGGNLVRAAVGHPDLFGGDVLVTNVDTLTDLDLAAVVALHSRTGALMTIALTRNPGVPNEGAFYVSPSQEVLYTREASSNVRSETSAARLAAFRASSTGVVVVMTALLYMVPWSPPQGPLSLYRDVMAYALSQGRVTAYDNGERFFIDVGTVPTWTFVSSHPERVTPYLQYRR